MGKIKFEKQPNFKPPLPRSPFHIQRHFVGKWFASDTRTSPLNPARFLSQDGTLIGYRKGAGDMVWEGFFSNKREIVDLIKQMRERDV